MHGLLSLMDRKRSTSEQQNLNKIPSLVLRISTPKMRSSTLTGEVKFLTELVAHYA